MSQNNEFAHVLDDNESETQELIDDLDTALNAVVAGTGVNLNDRAKKFSDSLEKGVVPIFDGLHTQDLAYAWARQNSTAILDLRKQYKWFLQ